jgi:FtsH-binding integral membrane protein
MADNSTKQAANSDERTKGMRPIWFFVGLVLLSIGGVLLVTGLYYLANPAPSVSAVANLHPNIWWGGVMLVAGAIFLYTSKDTRIH